MLKPNRLNKTTNYHAGFTLIELLIVIAIILILIAIALPNFLEAQIRARITKARGEIKTLATALEAYYLDYGGYPRDHDSAWPIGPSSFDQDGFTQLTSPIKYITSLASDPFGQNVITGEQLGGGVYRNAAFYYEGGSGSDYGPGCGVGFGTSSRKHIYMAPEFRKWNAKTCIHSYLAFSIGPDGDDSTDGNDEFPYSTTLHIYSPTNGTSSRGDIYKTTGEWRRGYVFRSVSGTGFVKYNGEGE